MAVDNGGIAVWGSNSTHPLAHGIGQAGDLQEPACEKGQDAEDRHPGVGVAPTGHGGAGETPGRRGGWENCDQEGNAMQQHGSGVPIKWEAPGWG